jgi:murein DD-endopeptidase MepM/ murein hydrolase activator NlpD
MTASLIVRVSRTRTDRRGHDRLGNLPEKRLDVPRPRRRRATPSAASARVSQPFFSRPFNGDFPTGNLFDHDKPVVFEDANGYQITMCGARETDQVDGHNGYDWRMPEGTPLFAVAEGLVMFGGLEPPFFCPPLNRTVQSLFVQMPHRAPDGTEFISIYGHLSRVDVVQGAVIVDWTAIGLSGNTGCSGTPHLQFGAFRGRPSGEFVVIDPYVWHAAAPDPWEADPRGVPSVWLWREGAAPAAT